MKQFDNGNRFYYDSQFGRYVLRNKFGVLLQSFDKDYIESMNEDQKKSLFITLELDIR